MFKKYIREFAETSFLDEETIALFYNDFFSGLTAQKSPKIIALAGTSGAGKTTYRKKYLKSLVNYHVHDMDEILIRLPGYQNDLATGGQMKAFDLWWEKARIVCTYLIHKTGSLMVPAIYLIFASVVALPALIAL